MIIVFGLYMLGSFLIDYCLYKNVYHCLASNSKQKLVDFLQAIAITEGEKPVLKKLNTAMIISN